SEGSHERLDHTFQIAFLCRGVADGGCHLLRGIHVDRLLVWYWRLREFAMNKRQTRFFAIGASLLSALAFIGLTLDSHRQFGKLTNADQITPAVTRGKDVWHKNNCINCHTVF